MKKIAILALLLLPMTSHAQQAAKSDSSTTPLRRLFVQSENLTAPEYFQKAGRNYNNALKFAAVGAGIGTFCALYQANNDMSGEVNYSQLVVVRVGYGFSAALGVAAIISVATGNNNLIRAGKKLSANTTANFGLGATNAYVALTF
jgi:hypothetical protein